jgi:NAD(P)-dependent dehydrogenase (short-subunit alcohol dehydrogenase family)
MILVTGGTHGIGRACVAREAGEALQAALAGATYLQCDVAIEAECRHAVDEALRLGNGRLDGLVNNAGMSSRTAFAESSAAEWDEIMAVNVRSAFLFTRFALAALREAGGAIVNIASIAGKAGEEGLAIYTASKAALIGLTQSLALEFGDRVRINAVCPGQVDTRMMKRITDDAVKRRRLELRIPAGRFAKPTEIANVVAWLLSSEASYVNGTTITVDGGETAGVRLPRV